MRRLLTICFMVISLIVVHDASQIHNKYKDVSLLIDSDATDRRFDGIGAISGGGATSKLLVNYPEPQRTQILDFLFKPKFGASLQILKVEIGGDSQSTDGSESSHMHNETDYNLHRGYEWWMMKEAKKRNPNIKLYGLPWTFPGWLGGKELNPYVNKTKLVRYFVNWVDGAYKQHGLVIDYIGLWNERPYDVAFFPMLRAGLDAAGYHHVAIVGGDSAYWSIADDYWRHHSQLAGSVDIIGVHYPGITGYVAPPAALNSSLRLWASEEYSAYNDWRGGACWGRVLASAYVNARLTAVIAWNLIASYYKHLPYGRSSLMTADEPWSGHYDVNFPVWTSAHFTHFTNIGWRYLTPGSGSGHLPGNGTYVTLVNDNKTQITIVLETFDPAKVGCFYPMPVYTVADTQKIVLTLTEPFSALHSLRVFFSNETLWFVELGRVAVDTAGRVELTVRKNEMYTLTSVDGGGKGSFPGSPPPPSAPFPVPYSDDFQQYPLSANPANLAQQCGSFEVVDSGDKTHGQVACQVVTTPPVDTCRPARMPRPTALIGDFAWTDVDVSMSVHLPAPPLGSSGAFLAVRSNKGGCDSMYADGVYLWLLPAENNILLTGNASQSRVFHSAHYDLAFDRWYNVRLRVSGENVAVSLDGTTVVNITLPAVAASQHGFVALGVNNFGVGCFDDFMIRSARAVDIPVKWNHNYDRRYKKEMVSPKNRL